MTEHRCILCNCEIENVEQLELALRGVWEVVLAEILPQVSIEFLKESSICELCYDTIASLKTFKKHSYETECGILSYRNAQNIAPVELNDMMQDMKPNLNKYVNTCSICLQIVVAEKPEILDGHYLGVIRNFLPKLNVNLVPAPVSCRSCWKYLKQFHHIRVQCEQKQEEYNKDKLYLETIVSESLNNISKHFSNPEPTQQIKVEQNNCEPNMIIDLTDCDDVEEVTGNEYLININEIKNLTKNEQFSIPDLTRQIKVEQNNCEPNVIVPDLNDCDAIEGVAWKGEYLININDIKNLTKNKRVGSTKEKYNFEEYCIKNDKGEKSYRCPYCEYTTTTKYNLKPHIECRHGQASTFYECYHCGYKIPRKIQLERHLRMKHTRSDVVYECEKCDFKTHIIEYMRKHVKYKHSGECTTFNCQLCDFKSKWRGNLKKHIRNRHEKPNKIHKCPHCEFTSQKRRPLRRHIRSQHTKDEDMFRCQQCSYKTTMKDYLKRHFKFAHDETLVLYPCELCKYKAKRPYDLKKHIELMHEKKELETEILKCWRCDYTTLRKKSFADHVRQHITNRVFKCTECSYESKFKNNLIKHTANKHTKDVPLVKCEECDYKTKWKESLKRHVENRHTADKTLFKCLYCNNYEVRHRRTLAAHIRAKHGKQDKSYNCTQCSFKSNLAEYLRKHVNLVHKAKVLYSCSICNFEAKIKSSVKRHLQSIHGKSVIDEDTDLIKIKLQSVDDDKIEIKEEPVLPTFQFVNVDKIAVKEEAANNIEEIMIKVENHHGED